MLRATVAAAPLAWKLFVTTMRTLKVAKEIDYLRRRYLAAREEDRMALYEGSFHLVKAAMVITRAQEDVAVMDFHCAPIHDGLIIDRVANDDELDLIAARLLAFWNALDGFFRPEEALDRIVFHDAGPSVTDEDGFTLRDDGTRQKDHPHSEPANPALRTDVLTGHAGISATDRWLPPQVAATITFKTTARRSWGRVYVPMGDEEHLVVATTASAGVGQLKPATCAALADAAEDLVNGLSDDDVPLVVWSARHQNARSVDEVQVDSLYDIIRSRRYKHAHTFERRVIPA